eukprot:snap_masked-scaffold_18-processed-gene-6.33-mRNA-1 protein AED:0.01 eAED:0.01 QI:0/-1/0/1/-1/1/1/0/1032
MKLAQNYLPYLGKGSIYISKRYLSAHIVILNEVNGMEKRVAVVPEHVEKLRSKDFTVSVASGAGVQAGYSDEAYKTAGANIVSNNSDISLSASDYKNIIVPSLSPIEQVDFLETDKTLSFISQYGFSSKDSVLQKYSSFPHLNVINLNQLLRTLSRGQNYDVMSSQANLAGYRGVLEASFLLDRPFSAMSTAAGRVAPANVLIVGSGVAGLAAIQTAKALGGVVKAFDVRSAAKEQVEAMGAQFLDFQKASGEGSGGYAKEMGADWLIQAQDFLAPHVSKSNVIVTTAQVPNKPAPKLLTKAMFESTPEQCVVVDLAASTGGNAEFTKLDTVEDYNGTKVIGYSLSSMASRIPGTSSKLYSGNVTNLILDMAKEGEFVVDEHDIAVSSMLMVKDSKVSADFIPPADPTPKRVEGIEKLPPTEDEIKSNTFRQAGMLGLMGIGGVTAASAVPSMGLLSSFVLSTYLGSLSVRGVAHALHSPLMSITNAISGMTVVGGLLQLPASTSPATASLALGAIGLSAVNLSGGFLVTKKMLDMFKRKDDAPEFFQYYLLPPAAVGGTYLAGLGFGLDLTPSIALASGVGCIAGIGLMSNQQTSRMAHYVALGGVGLGLTGTLVQMGHISALQGGGLVGSLGIGAIAGQYIANRVGPTQLPQAVAGFHSLVGVAALSTAVNDFMLHGSEGSMFHSSSLFMGAWLGGMTATGSVVACGKLAEWNWMPSKPLALPGRDMMNVGMGLGSAASLAGFVTTKDPSVAAACLGTGSALSGLLGLHMTASIGGADMPVVITLLNSYSGWALCAEGFILDQPLLTIVGALIGSSGAFLTKIMCDGMNRSLPNVILGGFGSDAGAISAPGEDHLPHTEVSVDTTAEILKAADKICIIPGYGLAVAQAQKDLASIALELANQGKTVQFAVHPVAGRMPGQLNVLLAEAGVPYDMVFELEDVNPNMEEVDVCLVVGANDTINSAAVDDPNSAIAGMPVIEVWRAKNVIVSKRSVASGYAGVDNPVFYKQNTDMLLGSASDTCAKLRVAVSE